MHSSTKIIVPIQAHFLFQYKNIKAFQKYLFINYFYFNKNILMFQYKNISQSTNPDLRHSCVFIFLGFHPCFVVFDMLVINEKKLANVPLSERIKSMEK